MGALCGLFAGEAATGIGLLLATFLALSAANSPLRDLYQQILDLPVSMSAGSYAVAKPLLLWVNDGLMALFFFSVGLEIKRELLEGQLRDPRRVVVPAAAALGGMLVPAAIYGGLNLHDPAALKGWAIPMATDIAFALGILSLLGSRIHPSLKLFLLTLAIIDDLGAIVVIALFYAHGFSFMAFIAAGVILAGLIVMNRTGVRSSGAYLLGGLLLWLATLESGVHATLAGVLLGLVIPLRGNKRRFHGIEHALEAPVNRAILPLFAFVNTGIDFSAIGWDDLASTLTLGIVAGLALGKPLGILAFSWLSVRLGIGALPAGIGWRELTGLAILGGIGFTMSLFLGSLAFDPAQSGALADERLGILIASLLSGAIGLLWLRSITGDAKE
ncbi:Na+/H+ antiporter NhaA [Nitratifractor sp.]